MATVLRRLALAGAIAAIAFGVSTMTLHGCGDDDQPCCPVCGDGVCSGDENSCNCALDGCPSLVCVAILSTCGNGSCERSASPAESHERCPADCPLDCRVCTAQATVVFDGTTSEGVKCPPGATAARRQNGFIVCDACTIDVQCRDPAAPVCATDCAPGCEDDTGGCCPVRLCVAD